MVTSMARKFSPSPIPSIRCEDSGLPSLFDPLRQGARG
jgi:hypothetical protein